MAMKGVDLSAVGMLDLLTVYYIHIRFLDLLYAATEIDKG